MSQEEVISSHRSESMRHSLSEGSLAAILNQSTSLHGSQQEMIKNLVDRIRDLESDNLTLRRSIPHLRDADGKNVSDEMIRLADNLEKMREEREELGRKHEMLNRKYRELASKAEEERRRLEEQVQEVIERANNFERDNMRLRAKLHHDDSMQSDLQRAEPAESVHRDDFEEDPSSADTTDDFYILQARAARAAGENARLREELDKANQKIEELQRKVDTGEEPSGVKDLKEQLEAAKQQVRKRDNMLKVLIKQKAGENAFSFSHDMSSMNMDATDERMLVAGLLAVLSRLKENWQANANLHREVIDFLREKGYDEDDQQIALLTRTFRQNMRERVRRAAAANNELMADYQDASGLVARMQQLDEETSTYSDRDDDQSNYSGPVDEPRERVFNVSVAFDMTRDIADRSHAVMEGMSTVGDRMSNMKRTCTQLFEKLRETAFFLEQLLEKVEHSEGNRSLIDKIRGLQLDLDQSMGEAHAAQRDISKVQDNMRSLHQLLEQTLDQSVLGRTHHTADLSALGAPVVQPTTEEKAIQEQLQQLREQLAAAEKTIQSKKTVLDDELTIKAKHIKEIKSLREQLDLAEQENVEVKDKISEMTEEMGLLQQQNQDALDKLEELRQSLQAERTRVDEARCDLKENQERFERIRTDLQCQAEAYQAEVERSQHKDSEIDGLQSEVRHLNEEIRRLQSQLNAPCDGCSERDGLLREYSERLTQAEELHAVLEAELQLKKEEVEQLEHNLHHIQPAHSGAPIATDKPMAGDARSPVDRMAAASAMRHSQSSHEGDERAPSGIPRLRTSKPMAPSVDAGVLKQLESMRAELTESRQMLLDIRNALPHEDPNRQSPRFTAQDAKAVVEWIRTATEVKREFDEDRRVLADANRIMVEKLNAGAAEGGYPLDLPALGLDDSSVVGDDSESEESAKDFEEFHSFLCDCEQRSNKLVQTLKKLDAECKIKNFAKLPELITDVLKQGRNLRAMLHRIAKYFAAQKENLPNVDVNLGREIRKHLQEIYNTLKDAGASTTSSKHKGTTSSR